MSRVYPPETHCLKPDAWPAVDRAAWAIALAPLDPFEPTVGLASRWKASTRGLYVNAYGRWLTWLRLSGQLSMAEAPGARATDARVKGFYQSLKSDGLAPLTIAGRLAGLARVLEAMDPTGDVRWISRAAGRLYKSPPVKDVAIRLRPAAEVVQLGRDLMQEAEGGGIKSQLHRAIMFRDGLMIAFLAHRPVRIVNLAAIDIDAHLHRRGEEWWVAFPADEMKQSNSFEFPWPADLDPALGSYLQDYRQTLIVAEEGSDSSPRALWTTHKGGRLRKGSIHRIVSQRTKRRFGVAINPHAFRHLAATTIATDDPEGVTAVAAVLGHTSLETSEIHYNKAKQVDAGRQYQAVVEALRRPERLAHSRLPLRRSGTAVRSLDSGRS
ncbi:MAG: tyrosine-type recombinase/integrase [Caulobacteraceae bacterium]